MVFQIAVVSLIATIGFLLISVLGGFGLTLSVFKGLTSIPPFFFIAIGVFIIILLLKGKKGGK